MTAYIVVVMLILYFFIDNMFGIDTSIGDNETVVNTMLFETFIYMHLFNEINCRKVGATEYNVFHNILSNWYFIIVVGGLMVLQVFLVEYGGLMAQTEPLTREQHAFCFLWGVSSLIASALLKLTPAEWTEKIPVAVDENKPVSDDDPIMSMYNKHANAKVTKSKGPVDEQPHQEIQ